MTDLTTAQTNWHEQATALQAELAALAQALVDAEAELAERLLTIHAFEFKLRLRVGNLVRRLDELATEIKALRQQLRDRDQEWGDALSGETKRSFGYVEEGAAAGDYRYRDGTAVSPDQPPPLDENTGKTLKQLYRQLAFRFHPDMALDEADRERRTQLMMAINAAYAAGDLDKLRQLALEPDSGGQFDMGNITQELVEALTRELERVQRRLTELQEELARLARHPNVRLMRDAERAAADGIDLLASYEQQLRSQISRKMVERDVLQQQLDDNDSDHQYDGDEDIADTMLRLKSEYIFEEDPDLDIDDIMSRRRDRYRGFQSDDDDILDDNG